MRQAVARRRRALTGLLPAALLAAVLAVGTASSVAASPLKAKPHPHASSVQLTHGGRGHAPHHGVVSPPRTNHKAAPTAAVPAPANATAPQRISFDVNVGVAAPAGRATSIAAAPRVAAARAPAASLGGILSLPQHSLFGTNGAAGDGLAAAGPWQIIAAAEGLALLALAVTLVRRRRVSNRPTR
jgi:hypothetical protein